VDGANTGISFAPDGQLQLQSRGHYLAGGPSERQFGLLKAWAQRHRERLFGVLGHRYILYGEWLYAKHTIYYDTLPHYLLEFDILDLQTGSFLSMDRRRALLAGTPIVSAPILWQGTLAGSMSLDAMLGASNFRSPAWRECLRESCVREAVPFDLVWRQSDPTDQMEGLYVKIEEHGQVVERFKYVRASFTDVVAQSGSHWSQRPIIPNRLRDDVDLFADV
jgi:hypothetical protein